MQRPARGNRQGGGASLPGRPAPRPPAAGSSCLLEGCDLGPDPGPFPPRPLKTVRSYSSTRTWTRTSAQIHTRVHTHVLRLAPPMTFDKSEHKRLHERGKDRWRVDLTELLVSLRVPPPHCLFRKARGRSTGRREEGRSTGRRRSTRRRVKAGEEQRRRRRSTERRKEHKKEREAQGGRSRGKREKTGRRVKEGVEHRREGVGGGRSTGQGARRGGEGDQAGRLKEGGEQRKGGRERRGRGSLT